MSIAKYTNTSAKILYTFDMTFGLDNTLRNFEKINAIKAVDDIHASSNRPTKTNCPINMCWPNSIAFGTHIVIQNVHIKPLDNFSHAQFRPVLSNNANLIVINQHGAPVGQGVNVPIYVR